MSTSVGGKVAARLNSTVSVVLVIAIGAIAAVLVHREFWRGPVEPVVPPPEFVGEWPDIVAASVGGDSTAPVRIVEFLDLQCPACRGYDSVLTRIAERFGDQVSVSYVHLPLPIHDHAMPLARAAECARTAGRFRPFVNAVFAKQSLLGRVTVATLAKDAGIADSAAFARCAQDTLAIPAIEAGKQVAERFGVHSTPTILVNGWRYQGVPGERTLRRLIQDLRAGRMPVPSSVTQRGGGVAPKRRTESGVTVLEHDAGAFSAAPRWIMDSGATATFGGAGVDPRYDLTGVRHVQLLSDGRFAALNQRVPAVLIFGADGRPETIIGRRGGGPREFRGASSLARIAGDTLLVPDLGNMRLNWLVADGGVVRAEPVEGLIPEGADRVVGSLPYGVIVLTSAGRVVAAPLGTRSRTSASVIALPIGARGSVIASVPDVETIAVATRYEGASGVETLPLGFTRLAHIVVLDSTIVVGTGDGYRIDFLTRAGRIAAVLSVLVPRRPVTRQMREAAITEQLDRLASYRERPRDPAESERLIREAPFSDSLPPYSGLFVSAGRRLWIVDAVSPADTEWSATAFDRQGVILARVSAPRTGDPVAFSDSSVVLRHVDDDGVVSFARYQLRARE